MHALFEPAWWEGLNIKDTYGVEFYSRDHTRFKVWSRSGPTKDRQYKGLKVCWCFFFFAIYPCTCAIIHLQVASSHRFRPWVALYFGHEHVHFSMTQHQTILCLWRVNTLFISDELYFFKRIHYKPSRAISSSFCGVNFCHRSTDRHLHRQPNDDRGPQIWSLHSYFHVMGNDYSVRLQTATEFRFCGISLLFLTIAFFSKTTLSMAIHV